MWYKLSSKKEDTLKIGINQGSAEERSDNTKEDNLYGKEDAKNVK